MSSRYFENKTCEYYPCHDMEAINCLFCFCPLYSFADCGGSYTMISGKDGTPIKDCSGCCLPHTPEGYDCIIGLLTGNNLPQKG